MTNCTPSGDNEKDLQTKKGEEKADLKEKLKDISSRLARIERVLARLEPEMGEFQQSTRLI